MSSTMSSLAVDEEMQELFTSHMSVNNKPALYVVTPRHLLRTKEVSSNNFDEVIKIEGNFTVSF